MSGRLGVAVMACVIGASSAVAQEPGGPPPTPAPVDPGSALPAPPPDPAKQQPAPAPPRPLPAEPLLGQDGPRLSVVIRTERPRPLRRGDAACVQLVRAAVAPRAVCVLGGATPTVETRLGDRREPALTATIERLGPRAMRVVVDSGPLMLRGGVRYTARTVITRVGSPEPAVSVEVPFRWRAWRLVGCAPAGATRIVRGPATDRRVGISFDDGPGGWTPAVLAVLAEYRVHATFFVIGDLVPWRAGLLRRVLVEGHMIGNHSQHHEMPAPASSIAAAQRSIRRATGFTPCSFRPPGGFYNAGMGANVVAMRMRTIMWSIDTRDWARPGSWRIAQTALRARPGDIILMQDGGGQRAQTVAALRTVLSGLRARGITPVPIEELLGATPEYAYVP